MLAKGYTKQEMYLEFINNFLTVRGFAGYYDLSLSEAEEILAQGKLEHEVTVASNKVKVESLTTVKEVIERLEYLLTTDRIELCAKATNIITDIQTMLIDLKLNLEDKQLID